MSDNNLFLHDPSEPKAKYIMLSEKPEILTLTNEYGLEIGRWVLRVDNIKYFDEME